MSAGAPPRRLRPGFGYRHLRSFQITTLIYDATYNFCRRFVDSHSRMADQMIQAARSGRQNIAEGCRAGRSSSKTELHLTNVARASLDELLLDYQDYLRQRRLPLWKKDAPGAKTIRAILAQLHRSDRSDLSDPEDDGDRARYALYAPHLEHKDPIVCANAIICLIHQANYLLDQQLSALEKAFVEEGGFTEQLATARLEHRQKTRATSGDPTPTCPACGKLMTLRTARQGARSGTQFWGCTSYPECKGATPLDGAPTTSV